MSRGDIILSTLAEGLGAFATAVGLWHQHPIVVLWAPGLLTIGFGFALATVAPTRNE